MLRNSKNRIILFGASIALVFIVIVSIQIKTQNSNGAANTTTVDQTNTSFDDGNTESYDKYSSYETETPDDGPLLADECDEILAEGYSKNGDHYQLVSTEVSEYTGSNYKIGVIKNNQWLHELSFDTPFHEEDSKGGQFNTLTSMRSSYKFVSDK